MDAIEIEHHWPRDMGGPTVDANLRVACRKCNQFKQNRIDAADFHYEAICLTQEKGDNHFENELRYEFRIAVWSRHNFACARCNQPAGRVGRLSFDRINPKDSWHFLNIVPRCERHRTE